MHSARSTALTFLLRRFPGAAILILVVPFVVSSCATSAQTGSPSALGCNSLSNQPISATTTFLYLPEAKIPMVTDFLTSYSAKPVELAKKDPAAMMGELPVFHVTFNYVLSSYDRYCELHNSLLRAPEKFPLALNWIAVSSQYTSLEGAIGLKTTLVGITTKNATLTLRYAGHEWKPIPDHNGRYEIQDFPLVKSHDYVYARIWVPDESGSRGMSKYVKLNVFGTQSEESSTAEEYEQQAPPPATND